MPPRKRRKAISVTLFEDPRKFAGGSVSKGQDFSLLRRKSRIRGRARFSAAFEPREGWEVSLDSRDCLAVIGDGMFRVIRHAVRNERNPATGRKISKTYIDRNGETRKRNSKGRFIDNHLVIDNGHFFAKHLRRTITDSNARWGGGFKVISPPRSRLKFYFANRDAAIINKIDASRKGRASKFERLAIGGPVTAAIDQGLDKWLDQAVTGVKPFPADTKRRARGFF